MKTIYLMEVDEVRERDWIRVGLWRKIALITRLDFGAYEFSFDDYGDDKTFFDGELLEVAR